VTQPPFQPPAVGTFYAFIDRLEEGPDTPPGPHRIRPSQQRKGRPRRQLQQEQAQRPAAKAGDPSQADAVTERLAQELLATADQPRPQERLTRLEDLLFPWGVRPSARRGRLGDLQALVVRGAGACLSTGASPHGRPTCDCRAHGRFQGEVEP
jgi:hypothetical protein